MTWLDVQQNEAVFKGRNGYAQIDTADKNFFGLAVNFTPTWYQVLPASIFLLPLTWARASPATLRSRAGGRMAPAPSRRHRGRHPPEVSFRPEVHRVLWRLLDLPDADNARPATSISAADIFNGPNATLADRDFVALTFKTTF